MELTHYFTDISLATVKLCLDLVLTGGDSRNEILYMENFRMGISQFVPERTARQDNDASIHGILGFGVPALGLMWVLNLPSDLLSLLGL